jgi:prophage antirepressor-like protein
MADHYPDPLDMLDEFEALAMGLLPSEPAPLKPAVVMHVFEEKKYTEECNPLVAIFRSDGIRILGSVKRPGFCAKDIADHIGDTSYLRALKNYESAATEETGIYVYTVPSYDTAGRPRDMVYLTEKGLYRYLLRSDLPKAMKFQSYVYDVLQAERERVVDSTELALKIERTRGAELQEKLNRSELGRRMVRSELNDAMRAANDAREKYKKTHTQLKRLQAQQRSGVDARIAAAEEANRTRGCMGTYRPVY